MENNNQDPLSPSFLIYILISIKQTCGANKCEVQWIEKENHIFLPNIFGEFNLKQQQTSQNKIKKTQQEYGNLKLTRT